MKKTIVLAGLIFLAGCFGTKNRQDISGACPPGCSPAKAVGTAIPKPIVVDTPAVKPAAAAAPILQVPPEKAPSFVDLDDKKPLIKAAKINLQYFNSLKTPAMVYSFGPRKITTDILASGTSEFIRILSEAKDQSELDKRLRESFDIYQLAGSDSTGTVVFSSYYEPTLSASLKQTPEYPYPIYARPDDLISVNLESFNDKFKGEKLFGRLQNNELVPYLNREQIDFEDGLKGRGLELAWLKDRPDVMDLHIEGSGRLQFEDGKQIKALYAATNSLKFLGWLTAMRQMGLFPEGISDEKGRQYLKEHPEQEREILTKNKRYTFFRLEELADPTDGPYGTGGIQLVGWRSIAIDNALVPLGTLAFMSTNTPDVDDKGVLLGRKEDTRFVFCQDTGGAIKGPGRVDFFAGNGAKAYTFAFKLWNPGTLHLLVLKESLLPKP